MLSYMLLASLPAAAGPWGMGAAAHTGFLAAHNPTMLHLLDSHVQGVEVTLYKQTTGTAEWQQYFRYPQVGINLLFIDLPSDDILGDAYSAMAFIDMPVTRSRIWRFSIRSSIGLGYLTHHFLRVENHKNSAIGSALNAAIQAEFENTFRITSRLDLQASVGLTHFSNGSFATPNLGLNNVTASAGLHYLVSAPDTFYQHPFSAIDRSWEQEIVVAAGTKEIYPPDNGKYFAATFEIARMQRISHKSRWGYGADIFYDTALNDLIEGETHAPSDAAPIRIGAHAGYQLLISRLSALIDCGIYVLNPDDSQGLFYHRIGMRYQAGSNVFLNLSMKTHFAKAEYVEWGLGYTFRKKKA